MYKLTKLLDKIVRENLRVFYFFYLFHLFNLNICILIVFPFSLQTTVQTAWTNIVAAWRLQDGRCLYWSWARRDTTWGSSSRYRSCQLRWFIWPNRRPDPGLGLYQIISELVTFRLCCHGRFYGASNAGNQDSNKGLFG